MKPTNWPADVEQIYSAEQVRRAWDELAGRLDQYLRRRNIRHHLVALAIMNGGLFPLAELTVRLRWPLYVDYVHVTRYRNEKRGGEIEWLRWPERDFTDTTVLLIDDIFDEGYTLKAVKDRLQRQSCNVITVALTRKIHERGLARDWVDFHGLDVPDRFVFGCGMDLEGGWRHIDSIWAVSEEASA